MKTQYVAHVRGVLNSGGIIEGNQSFTMHEGDPLTLDTLQEVREEYSKSCTAGGHGIRAANVTICNVMKMDAS